MTRSARPRAPQAPLADTLRQALAQGWHTLDALEALAGRATGARLRVHAALGELRAAGCVLEERVERGVAEVRLAPVATLPAPVPDDGSGEWEPASVEVASADTAEPAAALDAAPVAVEPSAPAEGAQGAAAPEREPTDPHFVECPVCRADPGHPCKGPGSPHAARAADAEAWARVQEGLAPVPVELILIDRTPDANGDDAHYIEHGTEAMKAALPPREPGPSSRCAVCARLYARHADAAGVPYAGPSRHPFTPKPRGRPRVAVAAATADDVLAELGTPLNREQLDAVRARVAGAAAEPETSRGDGTSPREQCPSVWGDERCEREAGHPCDAAGHHETADRQAMWTSDAAERWAKRVEDAREVTKPRRKRASASGPFPREQRETRIEAKPTPCRPPFCHRDDIHDPARVRSFARPLCEQHRRWVEVAGGSVAPCPVCVGIEPVPLQQRCVGIAHCAACMRALETLPMGAHGAVE